MEPLTFKNAADRVGEELGVSDWFEIDQDRITQFADCTLDHQYLHVDPVRAAEGPFGTTIAHGYLILSLAAGLSAEMGGIMPQGMTAGLNYGVESLRFLNPVKCGARIRVRFALAGVEPKGEGRYLFRYKKTVEIENEERPALVAETLVMAFE